MIVNNPDVEHSFRALDFGKGFYVTTVKEQAERWARRKADICCTEKAIVTVYDMAEDFIGVTWKCFEEDLTEWIDFVCRCRDEGMNEDALEYVYQENLAERIIAYLAETCSLSYEMAMDLYYSRKLSGGGE